MHVALDARFAVLDRRGIGRYTRALVAQLLALPDVTLTFVAPGLFAPRRRIAAALGVEPRSVVARVPAAAQVLWSPSNGTDLQTALPCVTTVHDVAPLAFPAADPRVRGREVAPLTRTAARARAVIADSAFMADEIARALGIARSAITVAPLGVTAPFVAAGPRHALPDGRPYVLHVGAHDVRKNVDTLIAGWQRAFPDAAVALAFTRAPAQLPAGALVLDAATDERLAALYRGAHAVAVPSLDEGFGLPLLEALACGAPAIAARMAALPEVGGDAVAWVDDARSADAWSVQLATLVSDRDAAAALAARGPAQTAPFTWERCARITRAVLERAVEDARR
jgi:glycosyltransferase involved in cell wall biosynthesis